MASGTVTVRLSNEILEDLQKRAKEQNETVSDVVRELIQAGLAKSTSVEQSEESNGKVIEYLEGFGGILRALVFQSVSAHYFAEMATNYAVDVESLLRQNEPMNKQAKTELMSKFQKQSMKLAETVWLSILEAEKQG